MAKYDVYRTRFNGRYVLDVQADIVDDFDTRIVVPLLAMKTAPKAMGCLHPTFEIDGQMSVMATHLMAAVPKSELVTPVANLTSRHDEIIAALDMLFQGF